MSDENLFIINFGATMTTIAALGMAIVVAGTIIMIGGGVAVAKFILK